MFCFIILQPDRQKSERRFFYQVARDGKSVLTFEKMAELKLETSSHCLYYTSIQDDSSNFFSLYLCVIYV